MKFGRFGRRVAAALLSTAIVAPAVVVPSKPAQAYTILGGYVETFRNAALFQAAMGGASLGALVVIDYMLSNYLGIPTLYGDMFQSSGLGGLRLGFADEDTDSAFAYAHRGNANAYNKVFTKAMVAPSRSWEGFYIGGNIGAAQGTSNWRDTFGDVAGVPGAEFNARGLGVIGGGQIGFNLQSGRFVYGLEAALSGSSLENSRVLNLPPATGTFTSKLNWLATGTARLGYTFGQSMLYVKGGVAAAEFDNRFRLDGAVGPFIFPGATSTKVGWTVGGGAERAINNNWSLRYDISYADFGRQRYDTFLPAFGPARSEIEQTVMTGTIGLNYRFGGGPVVAKY